MTSNYELSLGKVGGWVGEEDDHFCRNHFGNWFVLSALERESNLSTFKWY